MKCLKDRSQWIGLREKWTRKSGNIHISRENRWFPVKIFPRKPIQWYKCPLKNGLFTYVFLYFLSFLQFDLVVSQLLCSLKSPFFLLKLPNSAPKWPSWPGTPGPGLPDHMTGNGKHSTHINGIISRWCPSSLAKLVNVTPITMVYGLHIYTYYGL
jgi:hypothetical protein